MSTRSFERADEACEYITSYLENSLHLLNKATFSKPCDKNNIRSVAKLMKISGNTVLQIETFTADNKAIHKNISYADAPYEMAAIATRSYMQTNISMLDADIQILANSRGRISVITKKRESVQPATAVTEQNREKKYIIDSREHTRFLSLLGVCDGQGRVFDKKRSKYKQINRFLELLDDVYPKLPDSGTLCVCDLCCGKSYLTFAVYYYLTSVKNRKVKMYGVDLKSDVIAYCTDVAEKLGCTDLTFLNMDVMKFDPETHIDLVVSLHACDVATDYVLAYAVKKQAKVILSTPCCHHETFGQLNKSVKQAEKIKTVGSTQMDWSILTEHSMIGQKFSDSLTDALRALRLKAHGYKVDAPELIDPEETPKNIMIRAVYTGRKDFAALEQYRAAVKFFGLDPTLARLLDD